ncbi:Hypothetical protein IALB_2239 [Ignavibacterium album JCM 16511]|uniref:Outer membrane protein beta-barrel domain-containing protein n=1 Tax=Ignavibacterium album (strain DSM 19864 / JCM 16511 / NBRC 101810 / Mat9-16) TaxID=945713 RepID=I0ALT5_IGNAJ|nr:hypothetical protein [Ignavibacterium album]AFH49942.1 Hypothetical protein IALB_2239 [Ignavibacterium album JCM 16511]
MKSIFRNTIFLVITLSVFSFAEKPPSSRAVGFFVGVGVGPRLPIGDFASNTDVGYGFNIEFSYTDNKFLPVFLYTTIGFEQYPGSQSFYRETDYSNFHTNTLPVNFGARYYFQPLAENIVLFMPILQVSGSYTYYQKLHEFKPGRGKTNFLEETSKFGFSVGAGVSMFMLEILASYNYFESNQFVGFDFRVRLPIFISL